MVKETDIGGGERLPRELRSLIHHVELHRSGWWDRALERLVLVTLWRQAPASTDDVVGVLSVGLNGRLSRDRVEAVIAQAHASGAIVETMDGRFKPSEEVDRALRVELDDVLASEERVKVRLVRLAADKGLDVDPSELWLDFESLFMLPLVREAGARIYEVLTSATDMDFAVPAYAKILNPLCEKYGSEVRSVLVDFLDPAAVDVRSYVLRTLNADFVREAAGLETGVLDALKASRGRPDRVRVFLDTNFLFSFLELHDNPSNEVAADLIELIDRAKSTIKVELFVLPITVDETRRVLRDVMSRRRSRRPVRLSRRHPWRHRARPGPPVRRAVGTGGQPPPPPGRHHRGRRLRPTGTHPRRNGPPDASSCRGLVVGGNPQG
jgi:predicted transcriptional regulator